jgi:hypothetical protein
LSIDHEASEREKRGGGGEELHFSLAFVTFIVLDPPSSSHGQLAKNN